jgi:hypothetical protein
MDKWTTLRRFPDYEMNEFGSVRSRATKEELTKHPIGETYYYVLEDKDGNPRSRVITTLMRGASEEEI